MDDESIDDAVIKEKSLSFLASNRYDKVSHLESRNDEGDKGSSESMASQPQPLYQKDDNSCGESRESFASDIYIDGSSSSCTVEMPSIGMIVPNTSSKARDYKKKFSSLIKRLSKPTKANFSYDSHTMAKNQSEVLENSPLENSNHDYSRGFTESMPNRQLMSSQKFIENMPRQQSTSTIIHYRHDSFATTSCDEGVQENHSETKANDKLAKIIERLSRPTKSSLISSEIAIKSKDEQVSREALDKNSKLHQIVERISRPTKARLSYTSETFKERNKITSKKKKLNIVPNHELAKTIERLSKPKKIHLKPKTDPSQIKVFKAQVTEYDKASHMKKYKTKSSKKNTRAKTRSYAPTATMNLRTKTSLEVEADHQFQNFHSSLRMLLAEGRGKSSKGLCDRYYGKLYRPPPTISFESKFEMMRKSQRILMRKNMTNSADHPAFVRLYNTSKTYQMEGRKRRDEIEEKRRINSEIIRSKKKISIERACRLYYIGMESIKMKKLRMVQASASMHL